MTPTPARPALDAMAEEIDTLLKSATPGKWVWQTGSSWTRLGTETGRRTDGSVICPFVNQYDRHPDLSVRTADAELIVTLVNNAPALVAALRSLADMRGALEKATEAIIMMSGSSDFSPEGQASEWWAKFRDETFYPEILPLSHAKKKGKANG